MRTVAALVASLSVVGCAWLASPQARTIERAVLSDTAIACVLLHSMVPDSAVIAETCQLDRALTPIIETLLASHRAAAHREAVVASFGLTDAGNRCAAQDAGVDARADAGVDARADAEAGK